MRVQLPYLVAMSVWCVGCWTGAPTAARPVGHRGSAAAGCRIHDHAATDAFTTIDPINLAVGAASFAAFSEATSLALTVHGNRADARVETDRVVLFGELGLDEFALRPRATQPVDGWITVKAGHLGDNNRLTVELPPGIMPRTVDLAINCQDLTATAFPRATRSGVFDEVDLMVGAPLSRTASSAPTVQVVERDDDMVTAGRVVERERNRLRVVIESDTSDVVMWVTRRWTSGRSPYTTGWIGGLPGRPRGPQVICERSIDLWLHTAHGVVRVGWFKPHVPITSTNYSRLVSETAIELGSEVRPFVRTVDLGACSATP